MLYLQMALYCEARPLLARYGFHALPADGRFQIWETDSMRLTLSGTGPYEACTCATVTCTKTSFSPSDLFISLGTCASVNPTVLPSTLYLVHSLEDLASGRTYYPDLLPAWDLPEASLLTGALPFDRQKVHAWYPDRHSLPDLYDMESSAVFQAVSHFAGPHQLFFFRVPTDTGDTSALTPDTLTQAMEAQLPVLDPIFAKLAEYADTLSEGELPDLSGTYAQDFRCSASMAQRLSQILRYADLMHLPAESVLEGYRREGLLPVKGRKEGKDLLERFERDLR